VSNVCLVAILYSCVALVYLNYFEDVCYICFSLFVISILFYVCRLCFLWQMTYFFVRDGVFLFVKRMVLERTVLYKSHLQVKTAVEIELLRCGRRMKRTIEKRELIHSKVHFQDNFDLIQINK
jgi:hypothetical protein